MVIYLYISQTNTTLFYIFYLYVYTTRGELIFALDTDAIFFIISLSFIPLLAIMFKDYEKKLNNALLDFLIGGSYLGDYGEKIGEYIKKFLQEVRDHFQGLLQQLKHWYNKE